MINVYKITNTVNGKLYIGMTRNTAEKRWRQHVNASVSTKRYSALGSAIQKYGVGAFLVVTVYQAVNPLEAAKVERGLIAQLGTCAPSGYNLTSGGERNAGCRRTILVRDKIRSKAVGRRNSDAHKEKNRIASTGRRHSEESKAKIRAAHMGMRPTDETRAKLRAAKVGMTVSAETREKIRLASTGRLYKDSSKEKNRQARLGKRHTEEAKQKIREWRTGRPLSKEHADKARAALVLARAALDKIASWQQAQSV